MSEALIAKHGLADRLLGLDGRLPEGEVTVRRLILIFGREAPSFVLLLLTLPVLIPIPAVPTGVIFGAVIAAMALRMCLGFPHPPKWLLRRRLPRNWIVTAATVAHPHLRRVEERLQVRLTFLTTPQAARLLGLVILLAAILIILPIPLGNALPALGVIGIALGMAAMDGLIILAGIMTVGFGASWFAALIGLGGLAVGSLFG